MGDVDSNPIVVRLEALLADINEAEARCRDVLREVHTATKALQSEVKLAQQEKAALQPWFVNQLEATMRESLSHYTAEMQGYLDDVMKNAHRSFSTGLDAIIDIKRSELTRLNLYGGGSVAAANRSAIAQGRAADTDTFPGLKGKKKKS